MKSWTEDHCPVCEGKAIQACRCIRNERWCAAGHHWRRGRNDEAIMCGPNHTDAAQPHMQATGLRPANSGDLNDPHSAGGEMRFIYEYEGYYGSKSKCGVEIYSNDKQALVILTELPENRGTSITNLSEILAQRIREKYVPEKEILWAEHYTQGYVQGEEDTYDWITYELNRQGEYCNPSWERATPEQVAARIKEIQDDLSAGAG